MNFKSWRYRIYQDLCWNKRDLRFVTATGSQYSKNIHLLRGSGPHIILFNHRSSLALIYTALSLQHGC